ncbi:MAG: hypothetical protein WEB04_04505 [Dehalococcoidia bacterium]
MQSKTKELHQPWLGAIAVVLAGALALLASACGGGGESSNTSQDGTPQRELNPIPAVSEIVRGPMHFGLGLVGADNRPILGEPGTTLKLRLLFGDELRQEVDARFLWAIPDVTGFWRAEVNFDEAGQWNAEAVLLRDGKESKVNFTFPVLEKGTVPNIGDPAPAVENPTLADFPDYMGLSTDPDPQPELYDLTVAEAIQTGRPTVVVFATPAFCETRFCGPVVDNVQQIWQEYGDRVNFIHIEPFQLDSRNQLVSNAEGPLPSASLTEWRLQTEPWVFIVNAAGVITDRYEGTVGPDELKQSLDNALFGREGDS